MLNLLFKHSSILLVFEVSMVFGTWSCRDGLNYMWFFHGFSRLSLILIFCYWWWMIDVLLNFAIFYWRMESLWSGLRNGVGVWVLFWHSVQSCYLNIFRFASWIIYIFDVLVHNFVFLPQILQLAISQFPYINKFLEIFSFLIWRISRLNL